MMTMSSKVLVALLVGWNAQSALAATCIDNGALSPSTKNCKKCDDGAITVPAGVDTIVPCKRCIECNDGFLWRENSQECRDDQIGSVYTAVESQGGSVYVLSIDKDLGGATGGRVLTNLGDIATACHTWGWKMFRPRNYKDITKALGAFDKKGETGTEEGWILSTYPTSSGKGKPGTLEEGFTWNNYYMEAHFTGGNAETGKLNQYVEDAVGLQWNKDSGHTIVWGVNEVWDAAAGSMVRSVTGKYPTKLSAIRESGTRVTTAGATPTTGTSPNGMNFCDPQGKDWNTMGIRMTNSAGAADSTCSGEEEMGRHGMWTCTHQKNQKQFWVMCEHQSSCDYTPEILNMDQSCVKKTYSSGESCEFSCKTGFSPSGLATCTDGIWNRPACFADCPAYVNSRLVEATQDQLGTQNSVSGAYEGGRGCAESSHGATCDLRCRDGARADGGLFKTSSIDQADLRTADDSGFRATCHDGTWKTNSGNELSWRECPKCGNNCASCNAEKSCVDCVTDAIANTGTETVDTQVFGEFDMLEEPAGAANFQCHVDCSLAPPLVGDPWALSGNTCTAQ